MNAGQITKYFSKLEELRGMCIRLVQGRIPIPDIAKILKELQSIEDEE